MGLEWITPEEAAAKWGVKARHVQALCAEGKVEGAVRVSRIWLIPKEATKPTDGRTRAAREQKQKKGKVMHSQKHMNNAN